VHTGTTVSPGWTWTAVVQYAGLMRYRLRMIRKLRVSAISLGVVCFI